MPLLCVLLACLVTASVEAEVRNSVNYTVSAEIVDSAGLTATSTNYTELGSLGGILDTDIVVLTANEVASVSSSSAGPINIITATLNGDVTNDGGAEIVERGFIYALTSTDSTPTFAEAAEADVVGIIQVSEAGTTGSFAANITDLIAGSDYSYIAYAINAEGVAEGVVQTFTTAPALPLSIVVLAVSTKSTMERPPRARRAVRVCPALRLAILSAWWGVRSSVL